MNTLLQAIGYLICASFVVSSVLAIRAAVDDCEIYWPGLVGGVVLAIIGAAGFIAMREAI